MTSVVIGLLVCLTATPPASAPAATAPASAPAVAAGAIDGLNGELHTTVDRALRQYQAAQSYADTVVASVDLQIEGANAPQQPAPTERGIAFERPGRLAMNTPLFQVVCDGDKLYEQVMPWMNYTEKPAPKPLRLETLTLSQFNFFADFGHPLTALLIGSNKPAIDFLGRISKFTEMKADTLDGVAGHRVFAKLIRPSVRGELDVEIWFDDRTGLIGEIVLDQTRLAQASRPPGRQALTVKRYAQRFRFKNVRLNEKLDDNNFAFKPDAYAEKVETLRMPSAGELQQRLVGKPAIEFVGKDLDGKDLKLADYQGRVLLLDFWSQRCGPCIMSIPTLQKVADKYAGKPVSVVGVNLDGPAAAEPVRKLFADRGGKFQQIIQTTPGLGEKYYVEGIPCLVTIDRKGVIKNIHLGLANESELVRMIDMLLE